MMSFPAAVLSALLSLLPSPHDKDGWGLRAHGLVVDGPYLAGESTGGIRLTISLLNFSGKTRERDPLVVAQQTGALDMRIVQPDGKILASLRGCPRPRSPFTVAEKFAPGQCSSVEFQFDSFGYDHARQSGRHRLELVLRSDEGTLTAPPIECELQFVEPQPDAILLGHELALEGRVETLPADEQCRAVIQQVKLGNRVLLIYRQFYGAKEGGKVGRTFRLAELPGKREMTVEGAFGAGNPLTITYKTSPAATPTKLVINSINGLPWTQEEERLRQERLRPVKP
jgi:hypothetical protein